MATKVYETTKLELLDGTTIQMRPLKISLLREFMQKFDTITTAVSSNTESMDVLVECARIAMKQYDPEYTNTEKFEDSVDIKMVYKIIEAASGIKLDAEGNAATADLLGTN